MTIRPIVRSSVLSLLAGAVAISLGGCDPATPIITSVDSAVYLRGDQNAVLTAHGTGLSNMDRAAADSDNSLGVTATSLSWGPAQVQATLAIAQNAPLGYHTITFYNSTSGNTPGEVVSAGFNVTCSVCPPVPTLAAVHTASGDLMIHQGETRAVRFLGSNFLNRSPAIEFHPESSGLTIDPSAIINVQRQNNTDYFDLPMVVALGARTGLHRVRVVTTGGATAWVDFDIDAQANSISSPSSIPIINSVTPAQVATNVELLIKCEGSGFGTSRQVITTPSVQTTTYGVASSAANPDRIVVAKIRPGTVGPLGIRVKNLAQNTTSDEFLLFVNDPAPGVPVAIGATGDGVHRGGSFDLAVFGQNLGDVTDASWSGIAGLSFSGTQHLPSGNVTVHITADATAPLTTDDATNLTVTTPAGESPRFLFRVFP